MGKTPVEHWRWLGGKSLIFILCGRAQAHDTLRDESPLLCAPFTLLSPKRCALPLRHHRLLPLGADLRRGRKSFAPLKRPAGVDDHARAEALSFSRNDRIERAAPAASKNFRRIYRIGPAAHRPEHIVDVVGVDIVVDDNDVSAQIRCALALAGNKASLARMSGITLANRDTVKKRRK